MLQTTNPSHGWIKAVPEKDSLYIHLHDPRGRILELRKGKVEYGLNKFNGAGAELKPVQRMQPIEFIEEATALQAVLELKQRVFDALPIHPNERWLVISWLLTAFFPDCTHQRAMLKFSGNPASGKSSAARTLSCLLYGDDFTEALQRDEYFELATRVPLVFCDLPRGKEVNVGLGQFLNAASTGVHWSRMIQGKPKSDLLIALAVVTSQGPIPRACAVERTYDVQCLPGLKQRACSEADHLQQLLESRSLILSGLFRLFAADVLNGLERQRTAVEERLMQGRHFTDRPRMLCHLTLMAVILRALMGVLYRADRAEYETWEQVQYWVKKQT